MLLPSSLRARCVLGHTAQSCVPATRCRLMFKLVNQSACRRFGVVLADKGSGLMESGEHRRGLGGVVGIGAERGRLDWHGEQLRCRQCVAARNFALRIDRRQRRAAPAAAHTRITTTYGACSGAPCLQPVSGRHFAYRAPLPQSALPQATPPPRTHVLSTLTLTPLTPTQPPTLVGALCELTHFVTVPERRRLFINARVIGRFETQEVVGDKPFVTGEGCRAHECAGRRAIAGAPTTAGAWMTAQAGCACACRAAALHPSQRQSTNLTPR